jgi:RNA polymerase sigma factor (sigma-70 family)
MLEAFIPLFGDARKRLLSREDRDWEEVLDRLIAGDRVAFLDASDLVMGFLIQWRAYDFRDEWDDLIQEVILAAVEASRAGRIRNRAAVAGYFRTAARYKFVDWLRRRKPVTLAPEEQEPASTSHWPPKAIVPEGSWEVWDAVRTLSELHQSVIVAAYRDGMTHAEVALEIGIPQGSVSRLLSESLGALRKRLTDTGGIS